MPLLIAGLLAVPVLPHGRLLTLPAAMAAEEPPDEGPPGPGPGPGGGGPAPTPGGNGGGRRPRGEGGGPGPGMGRGPRANGNGGGATEGPQTPEASRRLEITGAKDDVSIFAVAADAHELFTQLGEKTGLRIIIDDTVSRKITVRLTHRAPKEIVDNIVAAYGLSSSDVNGIIMVSEGIPKNPSSYLLSDIDSIRTQYVLAATAKSLLPAFLQDHVKVNYEQNAVVLSGPAEVLKKFREDVRQFDIPAVQIMFDVLMVELSNSNAREWALQVAEQSRQHAVTIDPTIGTAAVRTVIGHLPTDFQVRLHALVEKGDARVRAKPRVVTVSGKPASVFIGKQRYISQPVDAPRTSGYGGQINFIDAGVSLDITPYTGGQGEIITELQTEVSTMSAPDPVTGLPEKSQRRANTAVRVHDGETIILGGLTQREEMQKVNKFPFLGDLPLIGGLFRASSRQSVNTELVIFITPRILSQTGHLPEEEERAIRERMLPGEKPAVAPLPAPSPATGR